MELERKKKEGLERKKAKMNNFYKEQTLENKQLE